MMKEHVLKDRVEFYMTIYALEYSPCGNYVAASNNYGQIAIFSLTVALELILEEKMSSVNIIQAHKGRVYSLVSTKRFLISSGPGEICGWKWTDVIHAKDPRPSWRLPLQFNKSFATPEVNSLDVNCQEDVLISGGRDNAVHVWDLETGKHRDSLSGHQDYIHSVKYLSKSNRCVSASEDGTVRLWDCRKEGHMIEMREPHKVEGVGRPEIGKWIGCVDVDSSEDWLVCGGGPMLSLWRLSSMTMVTPMASSSCAQAVQFHEDKILSGGTEQAILHWTMNGELSCKTPCTVDSVFALAVNDRGEKTKVLGVAGSSCYIDIFTNFKYKAFSLKFVR